MKDMVRCVEQYCIRQRLLEQGANILVALSGGADSVCLLHVLKELQPKWRLQLAAAHLHHGLRGAEADEDLAFVRNLCKNLDVPLYEKKEDVAAAAKGMGCSNETAGRQLRYAFLEETAEMLSNMREKPKGMAQESVSEEHTYCVATAHHKNDQAETVLMHLLRGSGTQGLAGIPPRRDNIIRPLLCLTRDDIEAYLSQKKISFRTDHTNLCPDVTRNQVRLELLPQLAKDYNPNIVDTLCRTAGIMRQQQQDWDKLADFFIENYMKQNDCGRQVPVKALLAFGSTVGYAVLQRMTGTALQWDHIQAVWRLLESGKTGVQVDLPGRITAAVSYGTLTIGPAATEIEPFSYTLRPGEQCVLPEAGCIAGVDWADKTDRREEHAHVMPYDGQDILIRSRQPGDKICTGGRMQRVKRMMIDAKIPKNKRSGIPVVQVGGEVVWVYGLRHADTAPGGTRQIKIWIKEKETCIRI